MFLNLVSGALTRYKFSSVTDSIFSANSISVVNFSVMSSKSVSYYINFEKILKRGSALSVSESDNRIMDFLTAGKCS